MRHCACRGHDGLTAAVLTPSSIEPERRGPDVRDAGALAITARAHRSLVAHARTCRELSSIGHARDFPPVTVRGAPFAACRRRVVLPCQPASRTSHCKYGQAGVAAPAAARIVKSNIGATPPRLSRRVRPRAPLHCWSRASRTTLAASSRGGWGGVPVGQLQLLAQCQHGGIEAGQFGLYEREGSNRWPW
jgi:hypothetical protein